MDEATRTAWVTLGILPHVGGKLFQTLLGVFDTPQAVLAASYDALRAVPGVGPKIATAIVNADSAPVQRQILGWQQQGVAIVLSIDDAYPQSLAALDDAPPVLFRRGTWTDAPIQAVAIVGTRNPSEAAARLTLVLARQLASNGFTIASGLASGVDRAAHIGALGVIDASYPTVAFLGSGVLKPYPQENRTLANQLLARGVLFSEVNPNNTPSTPALVARNRLISGFSKAVVVVETGDPGGAMHTVRFAVQQGRPVYTFDLPEDGNQRLIADGHHCLSPDANGVQRLLELLDGA